MLSVTTPPVARTAHVEECHGFPPNHTWNAPPTVSVAAPMRVLLSSGMAGPSRPATVAVEVSCSTGTMTPSVADLYTAAKRIFSDIPDFRFVYHSKDLCLYDSNGCIRTVGDYEITNGSLVYIIPRLLGGAGDLNLSVRSSFGCWICTGTMFCVCCGACVGSTFHVKVRNIDNVQAIWDRLKEQNPKIAPGSLTFGNEMLDAGRKILFYKIHDGDKLDLQLPPTKLFIGGPKQPKPNPDDMQKNIQNAKADVAAGAVHGSGGNEWNEEEKLPTDR